MATLSAHMIVKNGIKYDYPFKESCLSILPICDEFIFVEGNGSDGTYESLLELQTQYPKIKILRKPWEKQHYSILSDLTNIAIEQCNSDYHFQIQADEVVHEKYLNEIKNAINLNVFDFISLGVLHFYGSFSKVYKPGIYYDNFIRLCKKTTYPMMLSYDDAMTIGCPKHDSSMFNRGDYNHIKIHHYGYVRKPMALINKQDEVIKWWGIQERDSLFQKALDDGKVNWSFKHTDSALDDYLDAHPQTLLQWIADRHTLVTNGTLTNQNGN